VNEGFRFNPQRKHCNSAMMGFWDRLKSSLQLYIVPHLPTTDLGFLMGW